jgi:hypothetical protein
MDLKSTSNAPETDTVFSMEAETASEKFYTDSIST